MPIQRVSSQSSGTIEAYYQDMVSEFGGKWSAKPKMMLDLLENLERQSKTYTIWTSTSLLSLIFNIGDSLTDKIVRVTPIEQGYSIIYALDFIHPSLNGKVAEQVIKDAEITASVLLKIYKQFMDFYGIQTNL
jgi:hypothetical protein